MCASFLIALSGAFQGVGRSRWRVGRTGNKSQPNQENGLNENPVSENLAHNPVFIRESAGFQLGIDQLVIHEDFETAISKGEEFQRLEALFAFQQDFLRQTDGSGFVISLGAIFNPDLHIDLQ
jgi:hypothetical protein